MKRLYIAALILICVTAVSSAQTLSSSDLPLIVINTNGQAIPDDPKIMADMGIIYNGPGFRNNITDPFNHYNGKIGIEIRGQSSQMFPMKSYSIELRNNAGASISNSLFGLPSESDWVLYAPYTDKTLMRNFLAYTMSREQGHWAANCRYVELILNGEYVGIYVFMEKIKRNSGRVNIPKADTTGDALTGGYIFSIDKQADGWFSAYAPSNAYNGQRIQYSYVYPKLADIKDPQKNYIKGYVDSFENALASANYLDTVIGWRHFADEASFIDFMIVNEVSRNVDGYRLSSYFYKNRYSRGGKIIAGPVWDYDLAFRNANYCDGSNVNGWAYSFNTVCSGDYSHIPFWWDRFISDTIFISDLRCRWKELRRTGLSETRINFLIDSVVSVTAEARQRHFQKWPVLGQYVWPNPTPIPLSYDEEISMLKAWIRDRLKWIDENMPNKGACYDAPPLPFSTFILSVYPNPVQGDAVINIVSGRAETLQLNVTDAMGRRMHHAIYSVKIGSNSITVPMNTWNHGIYFFSFENRMNEKSLLKILK